MLAVTALVLSLSTIAIGDNDDFDPAPYPVNGYPCAVTNLLPQTLTKGASGAVCHTMIYGNWQDLVYAFWSGLDVIVDPYTNASSGAVNIVALQDFDVNVRHFYSFSNCVDITLATGITVPTT